MQVEMTNPVCPLCRRETPADSAIDESPSRLCKECRSMVETILPGAGARVAAPVIGHAGQGAATVSVVEDYASAAFTTLHESEAEPDFLMTVEEIEDLNGDLYSEPDQIDFHTEFEVRPLPGPLPGEEARTGGLPGIPSEEAQETPSEAIESEAVESTEEASLFSPLPAPEAPLFEQPISSPASSTSTVERTTAGEVEEEGYKEATDPWDDPLPAWEYSANEYPVLLGSNEPSAGRKFLVPAVILLFAAAVAAYFLINRPAIEPQEAAATETAPAAEAPAPSDPPAAEVRAAVEEQPQQSPSPEAAPASSGEAAAVAPTPAPALALAPATEAEGAGGAFSLQAASFPDEAAALQFSEHLIRATVPARVVAVDLGRRGKWYRVRVGRFASSADATKYAAQARERAASHGMNVQLIVCDYEKP